MDALGSKTSASLTVLDSLPDALLDAQAADLHRILPGPTLIHLEGRQPKPLFVSILLHGNEDVGLQAIQRVLRMHKGQELPRALSIFVGNVAAARENRRRLDGQPDYNRVWLAPDSAATPEHAMMAEIVSQMRSRNVFASIDLHNNTGHNPHYGCVTELRAEALHMASLFSRTAVFFRRPRGVQTMAFSPLCPAVTCECGKVGDETGVERATKFVDACLRLTEFPVHPVPEGDLHLFHSIATVKILPGTSFSFDSSPADLRFRPDIEWLNFQELGVGLEFVRGEANGIAGLRLISEDGTDITDEFLADDGQGLRLKRMVMPSMLTTDIRVIRQDCLGYFMERMPLPGG